jgi:hypothetical protein
MLRTGETHVGIDNPPQDGTDIAAGCAWIGALLASAAGSVSDDIAAVGQTDCGTSDKSLDTNSPLARLAAIFGLTKDDLHLLLLAYSARRDPKAAQLCGQLLGLEKAHQPTLSLVAKLLPKAAAQLAPHAPLARYALLQVSDGLVSSERHLLIDDRIAALLDGNDWIDPRIASRLAPIPAAHSPAVHRQAVDAVLGSLGNDSPARFVVTGHLRSGPRAAAQYLASRFGRALVELRPETVPTAIDARRAFWALASREFALGGLVLLIDAATDPILAEESVTRFEGPLVLVASSRLRLPGTAFHIALASLDAADRAECWAVALGRDLSDPVVRDLASKFGLGPSEISSVAAEAAGRPEALDVIAKDTARAALDPLARRVAPSVGLDDLIVPADIRAMLDAVVAQARYRDVVQGDWGFRNGAARGLGVSVLIAGRSGVGKTMAAEAVAAELRADLYLVDLSAVVSKYIGETEKALARIFDAAERSGAVLFFDEADALFGKRTEIRDSRDRWANVGVSYLLQRIEQYSGVCILATNFKNQIDIGFLRRLRFVIDLPFPSAAERSEIWRRVFPPGVPVDELDMGRLAELEIAGGHIAVIAVNAAFLAAAGGGRVRMSQIAQAARAEFAKLDKPFPEHWPRKATP